MDLFTIKVRVIRSLSCFNFCTIVTNLAYEVFTWVFHFWKFLERRFNWRRVYCLFFGYDEKMITVLSANKASSVLFMLGMSFIKILNETGDIIPPCLNLS